MACCAVHLLCRTLPLAQVGSHSSRKKLFLRSHPILWNNEVRAGVDGIGTASSFQAKSFGWDGIEDLVWLWMGFLMVFAVAQMPRKYVQLGES